VVQGLADIREMLSYQSEKITLTSQGDREIDEDISSEMQKAFSSWPLNQFQSSLEAELRKGIETTIATVIEQAGQAKSPLSAAVGESHPDYGTLHQRSRGRVAVSRCSTTTSIILGEMHYTSTSYLKNSKPTTTLEIDESISKEQLEVETSFSFVPSWWMTKFMTARAVKIDIIKLSTQGWQANIHSFNVRSHS
jgi:hypothetical protein